MRFALCICALLAGGLACQSAPSEADLATLGQVEYRDGQEPGSANSGERGTVKISEINWAGSISEDGTWNKTDWFIELRNEGARPINLSRWRLDLTGGAAHGWIIPQSDFVLDVGEHAFIASSTSPCFPNADWTIDTLFFPYDEPFGLTLRDADERLIEPVGSRTMRPFAGGYDHTTTRSMERIEIMFGGRGNEPGSWHYYTVDSDPSAGLAPNNDRVDPSCRARTLASPGRPNSPDYSGAFAAGSFE